MTILTQKVKAVVVLSCVTALLTTSCKARKQAGGVKEVGQGGRVSPASPQLDLTPTIVYDEGRKGSLIGIIHPGLVDQFKRDGLKVSNTSWCVVPAKRASGEEGMLLYASPCQVDFPYILYGFENLPELGYRPCRTAAGGANVNSCYFFPIGSALPPTPVAAFVLKWNDKKWDKMRRNATLVDVNDNVAVGSVSVYGSELKLNGAFRYIMITELCSTPQSNCSLDLDEATGTIRSYKVKPGSPQFVEPAPDTSGDQILSEFLGRAKESTSLRRCILWEVCRRGGEVTCSLGVKKDAQTVRDALGNDSDKKTDFCSKLSALSL